MRIVLDTNVLISGLRSAEGASFAVLSQLERADIVLNVSVPLVLEYEATGKRLAHELGLKHSDIDDVVDYLCSIAEHREIYYLWRPELPDVRDDMVLEVAVESAAEIITHNVRDFRGSKRFGVTARTPQEFLMLLRRRRKE